MKYFKLQPQSTGLCGPYLTTCCECMSYETGFMLCLYSLPGVRVTVWQCKCCKTMDMRLVRDVTGHLSITIRRC